MNEWQTTIGSHYLVFQHPYADKWFSVIKRTPSMGVHFKSRYGFQSAGFLKFLHLGPIYITWNFNLDDLAYE